MKYFDLGLRAPLLLSMKEGNIKIEKDRFLGVKSGVIHELGPWNSRRSGQCKKLLEGDGSLCLPGFVNGHTHLPMTLFRGLEDDAPFHTWLFDRILPLERSLVSKKFVREGAELAALECIRFGVTTVNEMYFYAEEAANVIERAGLRGIVSQTFADFPLPEDKDLGTNKFSILNKLRKKFMGHSRIEIGFGPHAPYSCGDELLKKIANQARIEKIPVHIHLSETLKEVQDSLQKYGMTPVERLDSLGLLFPGVNCAHCVHLDEKDREIFRRTGASMIYNPDSNAKLGSGIAPVVDYLRLGIPVAMGTDGAASNNDLSLFGAMDLGTKLQKLKNQDTSAMTAFDALYAATLGGAKALGMGDKVGSLEVGKKADFILLHLNFPHLYPQDNIMSHLVYSAQGLEVETVICEGKILFHKDKYLTLEQEKVFHNAKKWQKQIRVALEKLP